ncbi:AAA family ATPase [Sphingobacterium sp.]|uniref:AAA family ATPase n=1 Tax=Sphingobacterium sp. TaxID=341027 RepID=UPI002897029C|nr:AAA family ATPase [Sphingobacterium sp.]
MLKIKDILIEGFWGTHTIKTNFKDDVNIFIGRNGTGKTTFINLLQAVLNVDLDLLYSIQFSAITINLKGKNLRRKIEVKKVEEEFIYNHLEFKLGQRKYKFPIITNRDIKLLNRSNGRIPPSLLREIKSLKEEMFSLINVSYLSVSREKIIKDEYKERRKDDIYNAIDIRLEELIGELQAYQLQLETELSKHSKKFQENVLRTMLFNEEFDGIKISEPIKIDIKKMQLGLKQAYKVLGLLEDQIMDAIDKHVEAIKKASDTINNLHLNKIDSVGPNDVTPLTLLRRTDKIIEFSNALEKNKSEIFKRLNKYITLLNGFQDTKRFNLEDSKVGGISIYKDDEEIDVSKLSSGEKQLIILLTETLLQKESETLFIADEPELSLHIEWQRKVISSIRELNPNSQIIVATHSPEIVGKYKTHAINMERIING